MSLRRYVLFVVRIMKIYLTLVSHFRRAVRVTSEAAVHVPPSCITMTPG